MGQYWKAVNVDKKESVRPSGIKLTEHSWLENEWVNYVMTLLRDEWSGNRIKWIWDYADQVSDPHAELYGTAKRIKEFTWENEKYNRSSPVYYEGYLLNLDTKEYVDMKKYILRMIKEYWDEWIVHPLPLLTAISNWLGWWDYWSEVWQELVWYWWWDRLLFNEQPGITNWYTELEPTFSEAQELSKPLSDKKAEKVYFCNYINRWK